MQPVTVEAEDLRLVPWEARHLPDLQRIYDDPLIERFLVMPLPWTRQDRGRFLDLCAKHWQAGNARWAVVDAAGDLQGLVGLTRTYPEEVAISYVTAPWARGRGVAQRSIRAAVPFAFGRMESRRVVWDAIVGNHPSRLAALRTGFTIEGIARGGANQRGVQRDCWVGGILPGELRAADDPPEHYELFKRQAAFFSAERPVLETGVAGLRLRSLRDEDLDDLAATCADPEVQRWTTVPRPYTRAEAEAFAVYAGKRWEQGRSVLYVLADEHDRYSGQIELMLGQPGEAEVGYYTSPWARGRGWTSAALRRLCRLGFEDLGLDRIEWRAVVGNDASRRVAEKAGFTAEGVQRRRPHRPGEKLDLWVGSLLG